MRKENEPFRSFNHIHRGRNNVECSGRRGRIDKKQICYGGNYEIKDAEYKKELERLASGVDLLAESRRHG